MSDPRAAENGRTCDTRVEHTRLGVKGVDSRVDTELGNTTRQDGGGIQVSKGGGRGRVGQIVGWDIDGLDGGDGTLLGGSDTFLHATHISGEGRLVTDGGGDTTKEGGDLGTGLGEAENVVNEEQDVLAFLITEILCNGETSEGDASTGTRRLVHLTKNKSDLGFAIEVDDTGLDHFMVEIVTLTRTFTDT